MKILKKGKLKTRVYQVSCNKCDSFLEFETKDIHSDQREGNYVVCPVCGAYINAFQATFVGEVPVKEE